jgi:toxin FitB
MIILDTNVISEIMRVSPDPAVLGWLGALPLSELATTTVNIAEIKYGLARLPSGRNRCDLAMKFASFALRGFANRIFDFDAGAADIYGDLVVTREHAGKRIEGFDGLIATIARSRGLPVATGNAADFEGCGIDVINPWSAAPRSL